MLSRGVCLCFFLWTLSLVCCSGNPCAVFDFPTLSSSVLVAEENETVALPFVLKNFGCTPNNESRITIRKKSKTDLRYGDVCTIRQIGHASCLAQQNQSICGCLTHEGQGHYQLKKAMSRSDHATWQWTSSEKLVAEKELIFNVRYPAIIHNVTLWTEGKAEDPHYIIDPGNKTQVVCFWEDGNPPVTARLLDRHGLEIRESVFKGGRVNQILYNFPAVGCQDAGLIRCEATGTRSFQTTILLVRCPPEFDESSHGANITAVPGQPLETSFPVRTHTTNTSSCQLAKLLENPGFVPNEMNNITSSNDTDNRFCYLTGTPPDLNLTVSFDNVTREDQGQWEIKVSNDGGTGRLNFFLLVSEKTKSPKYLKFREIIIFSAVGTIVVVILCIMCICTTVGCRRRGSRRNRFLSDVRTNWGEDVILSLRPAAHESHTGTARQDSNDYENTDLPSNTEQQDGGAGVTHTFRPPSSNFHILRMSRAFIDRVNRRTSQMPYE